MRVNEKGASVAGTTKSSMSKINTLYYITWLMVVATIMAGWNISDLWSGIVAMICGIISISFSIYMMGGVRDDS